MLFEINKIYFTSWCNERVCLQTLVPTNQLIFSLTNIAGIIMVVQANLSQTS